MRKILPISFPEDEIELYNHVINKSNKSKYIRELIKKDIQGEELKDVIANLLKSEKIAIQKTKDNVDLSKYKNKFSKLINLNR